MDKECDWRTSTETGTETKSDKSYIKDNIRTTTGDNAKLLLGQLAIGHVDGHVG